MIIDTDKIKQLVCDSSMSATQLEKRTEVSRVTICNLRRGRSSWGKVWLGTLEKLQSYIDER
jgi:hypothetical protein